MTKITCLLLLVPGLAFGHARFKTPVPRNPSAGIKEAAAPCGGPRTATTPPPLVLVAGSTLSVDFEETIDHISHYQFQFSMANDQNFTFLQNPAGTMLNNVADNVNGAMPHQYTQLLKLPATPCDACTMRLIQVMTDPGQAPSNYYSCVDVRLVAAGSDMATGPADMTAAPTPADLAVTTPPPDMAVATVPPDLASKKPAPVPEPEPEPGFGCTLAGAASASSLAPLLALFVVAFVAASRRRRN